MKRTNKEIAEDMEFWLNNLNNLQGLFKKVDVKTEEFMNVFSETAYLIGEKLMELSGELTDNYQQ